MKIVVPPADPGFELGSGPLCAVKAELAIDGEPLLRLALETRPWWRAGEAGPADLIFVLRDSIASRLFAEGTLQRWYPGCRLTYLGAPARGAALSALAGVAVAAADDEPLCIDLADIQFEDAASPAAVFADPAKGAFVPTFESSLPCYSYLRRDAAGRVVEAVEKRVVSSEASAGVYLFRSPAVYLRALAHALAHPEAHLHEGLFYVCPLLNGVLAQGYAVEAERVGAVRDLMGKDAA
ncbi:MAG: hypothetical protein MO847_11485 [Candidatus Protistobacter heckmanni]|nr:hypothetical protein [Candidatus Protistobacter heckmanni]